MADERSGAAVALVTVATAALALAVPAVIVDARRNVRFSTTTTLCVNAFVARLSLRVLKPFAPGTSCTVSVDGVPAYAVPVDDLSVYVATFMQRAGVIELALPARVVGELAATVEVV